MNFLQLQDVSGDAEKIQDSKDEGNDSKDVNLLPKENGKKSDIFAGLVVEHA